MPAVVGQGLTQHRVRLVDSGQRPVGEDDTEAEGVVGAVALEDGDLDRRVGPPDQGGEEQPAGASPGHRDANGSSALDQDVAQLADAGDARDQ